MTTTQQRIFGLSALLLGVFFIAVFQTAETIIAGCFIAWIGGCALVREPKERT